MSNSQQPCRRGFAVWWLVYLITFFGPASLAAADEGLDGLIAQLYEKNQELAALAENVQALEQEAPSLGSLQDPVVGFGLVNVPVDSFSLDSEAMTQKQLFVDQKFPWFGTLDKRQQLGVLNALTARKKLEARRAELVQLLSNAWYDLGLVSVKIDLNRKENEIVTQMLRVAESRYATGKGTQADVVAGQIRVTELIDEKIELDQSLAAGQAKIGSILNLDVPFDGTGSMLLDEQAKGFERNALVDTVLQANPELQTLAVAVDVARVNVELARKDYYPNFDVRLSYGQREDNPATGEDRADFLSAVVALSVPLYHTTRQDSKLAAAESRLSSARKMLSRERLRLPHQVDMNLAEISGSRKTLSLIESALTVQKKALADITLNSYSVGEIDFNTMLSARRSLISLERRAAVVRYTIYKKTALLQQLAGAAVLPQEEL